MTTSTPSWLCAESMARPSLAGIVLLALFQLGARSPVDEFPPAADPAIEIGGSATPRTWSVAVDGWRIEVDGIAAIPSDFEPRPAAGIDGRALRLDRLALYADSIGRHAADASIDWRLVAAVIAEESAFDANALSPKGAFGLMQVKAAAARDVGVYPYSDPDANVRAGVRYLALMREQFSGATPRDHQAMMLAAYNMGPGHLRDAMVVAERMGLPTRTWDGALAVAVAMLERPAIYGNLQHGYAQGHQVVRYVDRVLRRHAEYRRRFPGLTTPSALAVAEMAAG